MELVQFSGIRDPQTYQWVLQSRRHLIRPEIVDRVMDKMHFLYQHNDGNRVRVIIDGMSIFVLTVPGTKMTSKNATILEDHVASTQQMCRILGRHLAFANTLPPDRLPLKVPLLFYGERMRTHPHMIPGSFDYVKKVDDANVVVIPYGVDDHGAQIVDPSVIRSPTILPAPASTAPGTGTSPNSDPNAALLQGVLAAMQVMTQVHMQSDQRNACMSQQQARLQAATLQSNAQQLEYLTNHLGDLGYEVGRVIANHPTQHSHTIQATLSHPNAVPGQSNDPRDLGSLTCTIPVSMSLPTFDYGPYVQAFQPQPNDKNTRRIDEVTHQIVQRYLPDLVKIQCDAAHTSGVVLPVSDYLVGFLFIVETSVGKQHQVVRKCWWHSTFGTGCITNSGFMLQPNIQERDFGCYTPSLIIFWIRQQSVCSISISAELHMITGSMCRRMKSFDQRTHSLL